jgi:acyl-CoA thioester hydrolase
MKSVELMNLTAPFQASETELHVRFADVDMMQVVHHSAYIHWFEKIRFKFMQDILGVPFKQWLDAGIALPLTSCELTYKHAFRFGDQPVGYARVEVFKQAKVTLHYQVFNRETGLLATTGSTTHCFLGPGHKLLLRIPEFFAQAMTESSLRFPDSLHHLESRLGVTERHKETSK